MDATSDVFVCIGLNMAQRGPQQEVWLQIRGLTKTLGLADTACDTHISQQLVILSDCRRAEKHDETVPRYGDYLKRLVVRKKAAMLLRVAPALCMAEDMTKMED
jgi:hypothetical protein